MFNILACNIDQLKKNKKINEINQLIYTQKYFLPIVQICILQFLLLKRG